MSSFLMGFMAVHFLIIVNDRKNYRLGMVVFAVESFTQCPLTLDYGVLLTILEDLKNKGVPVKLS